MKMTKQLKSTGILVLILVILAGGVWWLMSTQETAVSKKDVFTMPEKEIKGLTLEKTDAEGKQTKIVLQADGANKWKIIEPITDPAYSATVENLITALSKIQADVATKEPGNLADYGLAQPVLAVQADFKNKKAPKKFMIGAQTPVGYQFFAKFVDQPEILTIESSVKTSLDQDLNAFREKQLMATPKEEIQTVKLWSVPDGLWYQLERQNGAWRMTQPYQEDGLDSFDTVLTSLTGLMINDYLEETPDLAKYALNQPSYQLELTLNKGEKVSMKAGQMDEKWYILSSQRRGIFQFNNMSAMDFLMLGLKDLISPKLVRFSEPDIESLTVQAGAAPQRKLSGNDFTEVRKKLVQAKIIQPYFRKTDSKKPVTRSEFTSEKPAYRISMTLKGKGSAKGSTKVELAFFTNPDKKETFVVTSSERPFVYELLDTEIEKTMLDKIK